MYERVAMDVFISRVSVYHPQFGYDVRRQFRDAKKTGLKVVLKRHD
jgi:hypothetical protein